MNETSGRNPSTPPIDIWAVLDFWLRRWQWVAGWTLLLAIAGGVIAHFAWRPGYTASAQLIHYAPSAIDDGFHPRDIAAPSLVLMLQSPSLFEKVGSELSPPVPARDLARRLQITLDRNNDVATISADGPNRDATVGLVNQFTDEAIDYTRTLQKQEAASAADSVNLQLKEVESDLAAARAAVPAESAETVAALASLAAPETPSTFATDLPQRLIAARDRLDELLVNFTDEYPPVREQRARVAALEEANARANAQNAAAPSRPRPTPAALSSAFFGRVTPEEVAMSERIRGLESSRAFLISRQRAIQPFADQPPGYFRVLMPATAGRAVEHHHRLEVIACAILGSLLGFMLSAGQILVGELTDNRLKTRADVRRVTGLPVLATLGDLKRLSPAECDQWAFRAWTALQRHLSLTANHGMVCGITSAHPGEGRSTWINLLARSASACGFRVLTITARPTVPGSTAPVAGENPPAESRALSTPDETLALNASVLSAPGQISERLASVENPPMVNIPLPGWVWNLERRRQWKSALDIWRTIENVVIFVELPPANVSETVLLAENIPNILWLVDSKKSDAAETQVELETLRDARCNLVGAVLNREPAMPIRGRFSRWLGAAAAALPVALMFAAHPQEARAADAVPPAALQPAAVAAAGSGTFSVVGPAQRGGWLQKLTLGPGDVLSFHLFGSPELTRQELPVGPDGRISYLEAENVMAAGLTVDELRSALDNELGKFRRSPQTYVTPVAYRSKKYYVLGSVVAKGVYPLDRPITVIEAVARARGFESTVEDGNVVETADFSRSFVGRGGTRLPVDLEKLFEQGDLSQNVSLEPEDYLYFPAGPRGQVFVLGEVASPGAALCSSGSSVLSIVASRGGFTSRAWIQRILVVRGSLDHPQTFKVDIAGALTGDAPNLALKPGDLVYVSSRPWVRAEEILDRAMSAFVESAVITTTNIRVLP